MGMPPKKYRVDLILMDTSHWNIYEQEYPKGILKNKNPQNSYNLSQ